MNSYNISGIYMHDSMEHEFSGDITVDGRQVTGSITDAGVDVPYDVQGQLKTLDGDVVLEFTKRFAQGGPVSLGRADGPV